MRRLCLALLAGVNLNHARDVERVDAGEGVAVSALLFGSKSEGGAGGSFGSLPSAMAASVVSIDRVCSKLSAPTLLQFFCSTSEATQPSVTSGCQALVPTSYVAAMLATGWAVEGGASDSWIACGSGE
ncbi:hypothetical protein KCU62_g96, partial [Aureobasidium sp. EXF-3399]